jgi:hypothetical protein
MSVIIACTDHSYLMTRLSLQVFYLWRHVSSTSPPLILWWSNLEILVGPLHRSSPFIVELRCQAIQTEHGPYIIKRTQKAVYIVTCLWYRPTSLPASSEALPLTPFGHARIHIDNIQLTLASFNMAKNYLQKKVISSFYSPVSTWFAISISK